MRKGILAISIVLAAVWMLSSTVIITSANATSPSSSSPQMGFHYECRILSTIAYTESLWTPIVMINSPYGGTAYGWFNQSVSSSYSIQVGPVEYAQSSTSDIGHKVSASDGGSAGVFELDTWTWYQTETYAVYGDGQDDSCTSPYAPEITSSGATLVEPLNPNGSTSDVNEITSFTFNGYSSVTFSNGYTTNNDNQYIANGEPSSLTLTTIQMAVQSFSVSATIYGTLYDLTGSESVSHGTQSSQEYIYNFPSYGTWDLDSLNGELSTSAAALAFDYVG